MTEKDFKKIINDQELKQNNKQTLNTLKDDFVTKVKQLLNKRITLVDSKLSGWNVLNIYPNTNEVYICLDFNVDVVNKQNETTIILNEVENILYYLNASKIERIVNGIKFTVEDVDYYLNLRSDYLTPVSYLNSFIKKVDEYNKTYTLLKNTLSIVNYLIEEEVIKEINVIFLTNMFIKTLEKESVENKYYKYLGYLVKALDEFTNNKKYEIKDLVVNDSLMVLNITEAKLAEYRKLRKAIIKAISVEEETIKFDSQLEVVVDVNPIFNETNKTFSWHYSVIGKNNENMGGVYPNTEVDYQTAVLKGVFKGLKAIVDLNLTKKKIILKCDYDGILTNKMLTNDENKSRMKTINSLIQNNNLKITCK